MSTNKLKWYDWDCGLDGNIPYFPRIEDIPNGVTHVKQRGVTMATYPIKYDVAFNQCLTHWSKFGFCGDIIAYTLGEPLEGGE